MLTSLLLVATVMVLAGALGVKQTHFQVEVVPSTAAPGSLTENLNGNANVPDSASTVIANANTNRRIIVLSNPNPFTVYVRFGGAASATSFPIAAEARVSFDTQDNYMFTGAVAAFQTSGGALNVHVLEFVQP